MLRCLVVDDDAEIRCALADYLQRFSVAVQTAADGPQMRRALAGANFDVVVLDLMLPGESGLVLCQWLQRERPALPVLMLTAQGDPASRIVGPELGADDYLAKPFEPRELVARLHALTRRQSKLQRAAGEQREVTFRGWRFDPMLRQLLSPQGVVVALSSAEYRLLIAFVENPMRVLSRDQLLDLTRARGVDVSDRSVDLAVSRLRAKLGGEGLIRTLRGAGYLFDAEVTA
ncbi:MAG: response regulator transcription factor [Paucibacter sp.]|nr:response regulator transcription factor [Roseateles sp.]